MIQIKRADAQAYVAAIAARNAQLFTTPLAMAKASYVRVRAGKCPEPVQIDMGLGSMYMIDPGLGTPVDGKGEPLSYKGNCSIGSTSQGFLAAAFNLDADYGRQQTEFMIMRREFHWLTKSCQQQYVNGKAKVIKAVEEFTKKAVTPVFQSTNDIIPGKWSKLGVICGQFVGADTESRALASCSAETAYEYASSVDSAAHDVTRRGVCRSAEWATQYALDFEAAHNPSIFRAVLQDKRCWVKYCNRFPDARPEIEPLVIQQDQELIEDYVRSCYPTNREFRKQVLPKTGYPVLRQYMQEIKKDPEAMDLAFQSFLNGTTKPSELVYYAVDMGVWRKEMKDMVIAMEPYGVLNFCRSTGNALPEFRTKVCTDPSLAVDWARGVDKAPSEETMKAASRYALTALHYAKSLGGNDSLRKIACKDPDIAWEYATQVDHKPHPDTQEACSYDESTDRRYQQWAKQFSDKQ